MKLDKLQIKKLEQFLEIIKNDTYPEPPSLLHSQITQQMFDVCLKQISQDLRSAAIYSAFLTINSNIYTTSSVFT